MITGILNTQVNRLLMIGLMLAIDGVLLAEEVGTRFIYVEDSNSYAQAPALTDQDKIQIEKSLNSLSGLGNVRFELRNSKFEPYEVSRAVYNVIGSTRNLSVDEINRLLGDPSDKIKEISLYLLRFISTNAQDLREKIQASPALLKIRKLAEDKSLPLSLRLKAVQSIGDYGGPSDLEMLTRVYTDSGPNSELRQTSLYSFVDLASAYRSTSKLLPMVDSQLPLELRERVTTLIGDIGNKENISDLKKIIINRQLPSQIRINATGALSKLAKESAYQQLLELSRNDPDEDVRAEAAYQLGKYSGARAIDPLISLVEHDLSQNVRGKALLGLSLISDKAAYKYIDKILLEWNNNERTRNLKEKDMDLRGAIMRNLMTPHPDKSEVILMLLRQLTREKDSNVKRDIISALNIAEMTDDLKKDEDQIIKLLKKAMAEGVDERELYYLVGKMAGPKTQEALFKSLTGERKEFSPAFAASVLTNRQDLYSSLLPKLLPHLRDPASGRPRFGVFQLIESIRGTLSQDERQKLDDELTLKFPMSTSNQDICRVVCSLTDKVALWANPQSYKDQQKKAQLSKPGDELAYYFVKDASIRGLGMLFLVKAAPYCQSAEAFARDWGRELEKTKFKFGPSFDAISKEDKQRTNEEKEQLLSILQKTDTPQDTLKKTQEFIAAAYDSTPEKSGFSIYAKLFFSIALSELIDSDWVKRKSGGSGLLNENDKFLDSSISQFDKAYEGDVGSIYTTYALSSAVLALPKANDYALDRLRNISKNMEDPRAVPYKPIPPTSSTKAYAGVIGRESEFRSGAARSIPFHLALYLNSKTVEEKSKRAKDLLLAIQNYNKHSFSLRLHAIRDTSDPPFHIGTDNIAPYYYYPTVPYATAAIATLLRDNTLSKAEHDDLERQGKKIKDDLLSMLQKDGLFKPEFPGIVGLPYKKIDREEMLKNAKGGPAYANPLAGLALLPFIKTCEGKPVPKSKGILRTTSFKLDDAKSRESSSSTERVESKNH